MPEQAPAPAPAETEPVAAAPGQPSLLRSGITYTVQRIVLFVVVAVVLYFVGLSALASVLLALLVSGALSFFVLRASRTRFAAELQRRMEQRRTTDDGPTPR